MSYFSHILHELQVNGQTVGDDDNFDIGEDTGAEAATAEAPSDAADQAADNQNQEANDDAGDEEDDFTIDDEDDEDIDDTEDTGDEGATDDQNDDFTIDDEGSDGEEGTEEDQGNNDQAPADNNQPKDPTDLIDDDDKRAAEEAIYDSLTDEQKRIRILQLKIDFKDLYETINNTMEGINGIPKNAENLETIKRLITFLTKAKNILIDYVDNCFDNNSYLENYTIYIKYLAIFRTTAKVVDELKNVDDK